MTAPVTLVLALLMLGVAAAATDTALRADRVQPADPSPAPVSAWPSATATHTEGAPPWTHTCSGSAHDYNCPHNLNE
jgi:hypothetical protein